MEQEIEALHKELSFKIKRSGGDKELENELSKSAKRIKRQFTKMLTKEAEQVQIEAPLEDIEEASSHDSFESDVDREVAQLDQQWNNLVDEYVADKELIDFPTGSQKD